MLGDLGADALELRLHDGIDLRDVLGAARHVGDVFADAVVAVVLRLGLLGDAGLDQCPVQARSLGITQDLRKHRRRVSTRILDGRGRAEPRQVGAVGLLHRHQQAFLVGMERRVRTRHLAACP